MSEDEKNENLDSENETEETVQPEGSDGVDDAESETPEEKIAHLEEANKKLFERAKKAEGFVKDPNTGQWIKKPQVANPQATKPVKPASPAQSVEEVVLLANGMDEELLEQLKKVATVQGVSLLKAQNDPIFVAVKEKFEKDKKDQAASLPASRGSGAVKPKLDFKSKGLTEEQHREMFEAKFNK